MLEHAIPANRVTTTEPAAAPRPGDAGGHLADVGSTIRRLRLERSLSLRDVGRLTGFSISFLSLVERGRSSISLTSLRTLALALGVDMSVFFPAPEVTPEPENAAHVSRAAGDARLSIGGPHSYRLFGAAGFDRMLEPLLVTIEANAAAGAHDDYAHDGEEFAYVLSGTLVFTVDGVEHRLVAGDGIHYRSTVPHLVRNEGDGPAEVLWVLTPRLF